MLYEILNEEGAVINIIVAEVDFVQSRYPDRFRQIPDNIHPNIASIPAVVTMRQARLALLEIGKYSQIDAAIALLPSPEKEKAEIEWQYSNEVQRHNGFVSLLGPGLGLTETDINNLFILAASK